MRNVKHVLHFLVVTALLGSAQALADSATTADTTLTANRKGDSWADKDNVTGKLTTTGTRRGATGIGGVEITIKNPKGKVIGTGTTNKDGSYDIDTSLETVEGWTLTFECDEIDAEMTMD